MEFHDNYLREFISDVSELRYFRSRRPKVYKTRFNPLEQLDANNFKRKYRFSKSNMRKIIELLKEDLDLDPRGGSIPVEIQVMAAIRYWGTHEIQDDTADIHGFSQQTMSRLCIKVARALASKSQQYIKMPSTLAEQKETINTFMRIGGMPYIIGAIDCTHIKIRRMGGDGGQYYVNRKGQYSLNVQVVCNAALKICDIVCHWRGSTHDARIYRESTIKTRFDNNEFNGRLLGDSGYPCSTHLFTPVLRPHNLGEEQYNIMHIATRNTIERCFGVWKQRFRILLEVMRGSLENIKTTIIACAVLHNLAIEFGDFMSEEYLNNDNIDDVHIVEGEENENYNISRNLFISNFFNQ